MTEDIQVQVGEKTAFIMVSVKNFGSILLYICDLRKAGEFNIKPCHYHIPGVSSMRCYIRRNACEIVAHTLITSRLDYGNALPYSFPGTVMRHLLQL